MYQRGIMARRARHLAGAARWARAIAQFVDSLETFRFGSAGISLIKDWILPIKSETAQFRGARFATDATLGRNLRFEFLHSKFDFITARCIFVE
jgi:hypothetical protein